MARAKIAELRTLVAMNVAKCKETARQLEGEENPQLVKMRIENEAAKRTFEDVLSALYGDYTFLKISLNLSNKDS